MPRMQIRTNWHRYTPLPFHQHEKEELYSSHDIKSSFQHYLSALNKNTTIFDIDRKHEEFTQFLCINYVHECEAEDCVLDLLHTFRDICLKRDSLLDSIVSHLSYEMKLVVKNYFHNPDEQISTDVAPPKRKKTTRSKLPPVIRRIAAVLHKQVTFRTNLDVFTMQCPSHHSCKGEMLSMIREQSKEIDALVLKLAREEMVVSFNTKRSTLS